MAPSAKIAAQNKVFMAASLLLWEYSPPADFSVVKSQEECEATQVLTQPLDEEEELPAKLAQTVSIDETMLGCRFPIRRFPPVSRSDTVYGTLDTPIIPGLSLCLIPTSFIYIV